MFKYSGRIFCGYDPDKCRSYYNLLQNAFAERRRVCEGEGAVCLWVEYDLRNVLHDAVEWALDNCLLYFDKPMTAISPNNFIFRLTRAGRTVFTCPQEPVKLTPDGRVLIRGADTRTFPDSESHGYDGRYADASERDLVWELVRRGFKVTALEECAD